jgi:branched-chain amino acid aminotransferase
VDKSELFIADEVFFTGTAAKLSAVKKIEQYNLPTTRPIFDTLKSNFELLQLGKIKEFESFVTKVEID